MSLLDAFIDEEVLAANPMEIYISIRTDGAKGSGSRSDPYDGSTDEKLDAVLGLAPEGAVIRLGRGVFTTKGAGVRILDGLLGPGSVSAAQELQDERNFL